MSTSSLFAQAGALQQTKKYAEARVLYEELLAVDPDHALAHLHLAIMSHRQGDSEMAMEQVDRAIAIAPDLVTAHISRGIFLKALHRMEQAIASFDHAIALDEQNAEAHIQRGLTLAALDRSAEALAAFDRAIALGINTADIHAKRAVLLENMERCVEAIRSYAQALQCDPTTPYAQGCCIDLCAKLCDWQDWDESIALLFSCIENGELAIFPYSLHCLPSTPAQQQQIAASHFQNTVDEVVPTSIPRTTGADKLRIGYFSGDFGSHAVALAIAEVFENHDKSRHEVIAFSLKQRREDAMHLRLRAAFDQFIDVSAMPAKSIAQLARDMGLHIAVDLMGYTRHGRPAIFVHRAAPVQVSYLGFPGTMGTTCIDYILADHVVIPPHHRPYYTERVCYLPHSYQANDAKRVIPDLPRSRQDYNLPESGFVFCSFNMNHKISPDVFDSWMRILRAVDGSVLWLYAGHKIAIENLRREAVARGVSADRLVFAKFVPLEEHFARHRLADLFLDTFNYGGHGTASHALWAGLPVLTKRGETFASRVGASLLTTLGMPDLIAENAAAYEERAIELALHPDQMAGVKSRLQERSITSPLFDTRRFTRNLEAAYRAMWTQHEAGRPPEDLDIPDTAKA